MHEVPGHAPSYGPPPPTLAGQKPASVYGLSFLFDKKPAVYFDTELLHPKNERWTGIVQNDRTQFRIISVSRLYAQLSLLGRLIIEESTAPYKETMETFTKAPRAAIRAATDEYREEFPRLHRQVIMAERAQQDKIESYNAYMRQMGWRE